MSERMNKERAREILERIQEEKNHDDIKNAKQFLKNLTSDIDKEVDEDYINSIKKYI